MTPSEHSKDGSAVVVNDVMDIGRRLHRVIGFRPYPNFGDFCPDYTARIAVLDTGFDITVIDQSPTRVVRAAA